MHATLAPDRDAQSEDTELHSIAAAAATGQAEVQHVPKSPPHQAESTLAVATAHPGSIRYGPVLAMRQVNALRKTLTDVSAAVSRCPCADA